MAAITAELVKRLRDATGAGMMDCKKALMKADGDFDAAAKILKEMGLAAVAKRSDRATDNGRVFARISDGKAVLLEISCETDFVARNDDFIALGNELITDIIANGWTSPNDQLNAKVDGLISLIKENMHLKSVVVEDVPADSIGASYIHGDGVLGVITVLKASKPEVLKNPVVEELAHDIALHVAAFTPQFLSDKTVTKEYEEEQLSIFRVQAASLDKPEKVKEGIVRGKLSKLYSEICLLDQAFVKDDKISVAQKLKEVSKAVGADLEIASYHFLRAGVEA
ncbi:translation elongation factor Ts [Parasphaerochaeta coccoides]|uniref:Elongation factor Ts n=1 Tax=Parasphaerochaeta coccoides (strain ATCC BAA-1237 / DSM 17374 / SPN1) TaxID=760011 RepID=F4GLE7_PARC1|nr:translation elongation factor Ts [Parasphaerochaeta coccoides]AEC01917.1 Elongation factor Ts [Parasphaerochaeta coccoides DSM 17374]